MGNNKIVKTAAAVALGTSVVATAVAPGAASAATTYKIKSGKLYQTKSGKTTLVKGFKTYKKVLYKDGKKYTGLRSAKFYKKGVLATGSYKGVKYKKGIKFTGLSTNGKFYKNGVVGTATYKNVKYKKGVKFTGVSTNGKLYENGVLAEGTKDVKGTLYTNGAKDTRTQVFEGTLYADGVQATKDQVFEDTLFVAGKKAEGVVEFEGAVYVDGKKDTEAPVIKAEDQTIAYGAEIGELATAEDNSKTELTTKTVITLDGKEVEKIDSTKPGVYTVTYTATDKAGNESKKEFKVTVAAPAVETVKAINASELQVTFKQAVDKETAEKITNYELKVNDQPRTISSIVLNDKVATVRLASGLQNGDKLVLQSNNDIKTTDNTSLAKFVSEELTFDQSAAPTLAKVEKAGNNLELTFDRPVVSAGTTNVTLVKVDGIALTSKDLVPVVANDTKAGVYTYTIALDGDALASAKKVGKHEVTLYDVSETASAYAKKASVLTGEFEVTDAVVTPEVTGVEAVNANRLFLYTNTAVTLGADAKVTVTKGNYEFKQEATKYEDTIAAQSNEVDAYPGTLNNKPGVWVTISDAAITVENPLYKGTETSATLNVTLENFTADGLVGKKSTQTVTLNKNNKKPAIVESKNEVASATTLKVVFDNNLGQVASPTTALTTLAATDIVVRDKDGVIVSTTGATVSGNEVTVTGLVKTTDAPYTVEFKKDTFRNLEVNNKVATYLVNTVKNDELTTTVGSKSVNFEYTALTFKATDAGTDAAVIAAGLNTPLATAAGTYHVDASKSTITFNYGEKMGDSARDVANYTLDGKALPTGSKVDFVEDKNVVRITLPEGALSQSTQYKFGVKTTVTTEKGSKIVDSLQTKNPAELVVALADTVKPKLESAIYYVGVETVVPGTTTNKLEVTFNEKLAAALTSAAGNIANANDDFKVVINGSEVKVASVEKVTTGDNQDRKLLLTLNQQVNVAQAATVSIVDEDAQADKTLVIKDLAGNDAEANSSTTASTYKYNAALAASIQAAADKAAAIAKINDGSAALADYTTAGYSTVTATNLADVKTTVSAAKTAKGSALTETEIQTAVDDTVAVLAAKTALTLSLVNPTAVTSTIALPETQGTADVAWVATTGTITGTSYATPARTLSPATDTLTATITKGAAEVEQAFTVTIGDDTQTAAPAYDNANSVAKD